MKKVLSLFAIVWSFSMIFLSAHAENNAPLPTGKAYGGQTFKEDRTQPVPSAPLLTKPPVPAKEMVSTPEQKQKISPGPALPTPPSSAREGEN
ncbi:MAG: hypothetical protein ABSH06_14080 [Thermodesulfobacteriota bacterium]